MATLADAFVRLRPDTSKLGPEIKNEGEKHGKTFGTTFVRSSAGPFRAMGGVLSRSIGGVVAGLGAVAGIKVFAGFIADAEASAKVAKLTESTIRATGGAAKITADQVGRLAEAISTKTGKDDEAIQSGQNMLLTFKNIRNEAGKGNDIFNQASTVLTDMVAAMNGGVVTEENMSKGAIQLGKALNDPIKGVGALSRVGVTFTDQQKKQIAAMVEAGDVAGAQKIILAELKSEFGGAAEASSSMSDRMKVALGNLGETIGGLLLPLVEKVAGFVGGTLVPRLQDFAGVVKDRVVPVFKAEVLPRLKEFAGFVRDEVVPRLVDLVGNLRDALAPTVERIAGFFRDKLLPALKSVGEFIVTKVLPAVSGLFGWLADHQDVVSSIAIAIGLLLVPALISWALAAGAAAVSTLAAAAPVILVTAVVAGLVLGIILLVRNWDTIWGHIWSFMKTIGAWFAGPFVGFFTGAWAKIVGAWNKVRDGIVAGWNFVRDNVFNPVKNFITKTIPNAFRDGVGTIVSWWDGLRQKLATPINFVINTILNKGIIDSINWVAKHVGVKARIPHVPGINIPLTGTSPAHQDVSGGNVRGDGYGIGDGIGDGFGDLLKVFTSPAKWLAGRVGLGNITSRFGNNPFTQVLTGAGNKVKDFAVEKIKDLLGFFDFGGGGGGTGGLAAGISAVLASLRSVFGNVPVISGLRPGARTLSGNVSYHASGRAIDIAPVLAWAQFLSAAWGPRLRELITPWNNLNILNGQPHRYTGAVWNQHNFAGGNAHIHAAFDRGGFLLPGLNIVPNNTGRAEPVTTAATMDEVVGLLRALIGAVERVAPGVAAELYGGAVSLRQAARVR